MVGTDGRSTEQIDRSWRALGDDLYYLRKGAGFTSARIAKTPVLRQLLGGTDQPIEHLRDRLESAINSLHDPEPELLLTVFGLTPDTADMRSLQQRRAVYGQRIGKSVATVADLEPAALEHLANQLVTGWYPLSPTGFQVPQSHNGLVCQAVVTTTVVRDRKWQETRNRFIFIAAFDEADYVNISSSVPSVAEAFGDFTARTEVIGRSWSHHFMYKEPMRRGHKYDLSYRLTPPDDNWDDDDLKEESIAFHEPTRSAVIQIVFVGQRPSIIWQYSGLTGLERPGVPTRQQLLELDANSSAVARWHDLYGGLHHGVAWEW